MLACRLLLRLARFWFCVSGSTGLPAACMPARNPNTMPAAIVPPELDLAAF